MEDKREKLESLLKRRKELWNKSNEIGEELGKVHNDIERVRADLILESGILRQVAWKLETISNDIIVIKPIDGARSHFEGLITTLWNPEDYHCETPLVVGVGTEYDSTIVALRYDDGEFSISSWQNVDVVIKLIKDQNLTVDLSKLEKIRENCESTLRMTNELFVKF